MTIQQATSVRKEPVTTPHVAGSVHALIIQFAFSAAYTAATDQIELCALPANCKLVAVDMISSSIAATATIDIGIMAGTYGDKTGTRAVGDEFFDGVTKNQANSMSLADVFAFASSSEDRSIGMILSADEAATGALVTLKVQYQSA